MPNILPISLIAEPVVRVHGTKFQNHWIIGRIKIFFKIYCKESMYSTFKDK